MKTANYIVPETINKEINESNLDNNTKKYLIKIYKQYYHHKNKVRTYNSKHYSKNIKKNEKIIVDLDS